MQWVVFIPFAGFVGIWLLSWILRVQQEQPRQPPRAGNQRTGSTDQIDRFLQEIDRLRRRQEMEKGESARRSAPPTVPVVRPRPTPRASAPSIVRPRPPEPRPPLSRPLPSAEVPVVQPVPVPSHVSVSALIVVPPTVAPPPSQVALALVNLVRSPTGLPALVIAPEILGPPRCKRPAR